jgi:hypothetical protein
LVVRPNGEVPKTVVGLIDEIAMALLSLFEIHIQLHYKEFI